MNNNLTRGDKVLIAAAYVLCFPALHIIVTEKRKNAVYAFHAAQALLLWLFIGFTMIVLRIIVSFILSYLAIPFISKLISLFFFFMWIYCIYCAFLFLTGKEFKIPYITDISSGLV